MRYTLIASLLFFAGCGMTLEQLFDWEEQQNKKLESFYVTGTKRSEIRSWKYYETPKASMERPQAGWDFNDIGNCVVQRVAYVYEKKHNAVISSCDAYLVPRNIFGLYMDYLFYDKEEKLIGFHRRFLD